MVAGDPADSIIRLADSALAALFRLPGCAGNLLGEGGAIVVYFPVYVDDPNKGTFAPSGTVVKKRD